MNERCGRHIVLSFGRQTEIFKFPSGKSYVESYHLGTISHGMEEIQDCGNFGTKNWNVVGESEWLRMNEARL
jgi:hypothetical protein